MGAGRLCISSRRACFSLCGQCRTWYPPNATPTQCALIETSRQAFPHCLGSYPLNSCNLFNRQLRLRARGLLKRFGQCRCVTFEPWQGRGLGSYRPEGLDVALQLLEYFLNRCGGYQGWISHRNSLPTG